MKAACMFTAALATLAAPAGAGTLTTASQVAGLRIVALDSVPTAPAPNADLASCNHLLLPGATTRAGQAVTEKGWGVTAEAPLGRWTVVSFVGGYAAATSGTCELLGGNVGLFDGDQLQALIYADDGTLPVIGAVWPLGGGSLRIFSGDLIPAPVGDLRQVGTDGIVVTPPALQEAVCNGTAVVPFVYGLPIDLARQLLAEAGWQPQPAPADRRPRAIPWHLAAARSVRIGDAAHRASPELGQGANWHCWMR